MKYSIISGSARAQSQSTKISRFIQQQLGAEQSYLCDLALNPLPLWDETVWSGGEVWTKSWTPIKAELQSSDAFIFVVPEWGGMVPSALKNFFLLCSAQELGHKPALIVAISSARGGAYPVAELRMSSYKNNRVCYLPEQLILRDVEKIFNEGPAQNEDEAYLRERLKYDLDLLAAYARALKQVRESGVINHQKFPHGM